ncbi:MAG: flagellar biosynthetic protein FliO [Lachnospiraceae bacterium]|nr:flagellar biosynthetic protein FliO [Lachnospiraceae bacterium]
MKGLCIAVSSGQSFLQVLGLLLIFIAVLAATYFVTRWIAGFEKSRSFNCNLRVVETLRITTNKYVQIVKAGNKYLVLGIGKDEINLLGELDKDEVDESMGQPSVMFDKESFAQILDKLKSKMPEKQDDEKNEKF